MGFVICAYIDPNCLADSYVLRTNANAREMAESEL
jgi:hypothetical protein